jgi:DNA-directed RNA polymerase subunit beta'
VQTIEGTWIALTKNGVLSVMLMTVASWKATSSSRCRYREARRFPSQEGRADRHWDPYNIPIITEKAGKVEFRDMISGITITKEVNESTGNEETVVIEHKEDLHPQVVVTDPKTHEVIASYTIPAGAHLERQEQREGRRWYHHRQDAA